MTVIESDDRSPESQGTTRSKPRMAVLVLLFVMLLAGAIGFTRARALGPRPGAELPSRITSSGESAVEPMVVPSIEPTLEPQRQISLTTGLNLFSFDVEPVWYNDATRPLTRPAEILATLEGNYIAVVGYLGGGGKGYYPTLPPEMSDLRELDYEHGYYIYMTATDTLMLWGNYVAASHAIPLAPGPNLVSYLPKMDIGVGDALYSINGWYKSVLGLQGGVYKWYVPASNPYSIFSTLKCLRRNRGYWITAQWSRTLKYPATGICYPYSPWGVADRGGAAASTSSPPSWCDLYSLDSPGVAAGAVVRAYDPDGVLCGEAVAFPDGRWGVMHATGDRPDTPEDEGAVEGDLLTFTVDGKRVPSAEQVTWGSHGFKEVRWRTANQEYTVHLSLPDEDVLREAEGVEVPSTLRQEEGVKPPR